MELLWLIPILFMLSLLVLFFCYLKGKKAQKEMESKLDQLDQLWKQRWDVLPSFINAKKYQKSADSRLLGELLLQRNHIYDRLEWDKKCTINTSITSFISSFQELVLTEDLERLHQAIIETTKQYEELRRHYYKMLRSFPFSLFIRMHLLKSYPSLQKST